MTLKNDASGGYIGHIGHISKQGPCLYLEPKRIQRSTLQLVKSYKSMSCASLFSFYCLIAFVYCPNLLLCIASPFQDAFSYIQILNLQNILSCYLVYSLSFVKSRILYHHLFVYLLLRCLVSARLSHRHGQLQHDLGVFGVWCMSTYNRIMKHLSTKLYQGLCCQYGYWTNIGDEYSIIMSVLLRGRKSAKRLEQMLLILMTHTDLGPAIEIIIHKYIYD